MNILFVCEGNMMRSQMAEVFYNAVTNSSDASSAGAIAETKNHISSRAIEVLDAAGYDGRQLRPKQVTEQMAADADRIIYFPSEYMPEYITRSTKAELWDVADPHYNTDKGMPFVVAVRDDIRRRIEALTKEVQ